MIKFKALTWVTMIILLIVASCACVTNEEKEINALRPSIVNVVDLIGQARGTGWVAVIDGQHVIMSAKHIFGGREEVLDTPIVGDCLVSIKDWNGREALTSILSYDDSWDLDVDRASDWIILRCPEEWEDLPALELSSESPRFGENAIYIGFGDTSSAAVADRVIMCDEYGDSGLRRISGNFGAGASGSPIYDPDLGVVGMLVMVYVDSSCGIVLDIPALYDQIIDEYNNDVVDF